MLRIFLLGPFQIECSGRVIRPPEWARPKDRSLLKLLALERGHLVPQDRLLDLLWPDLVPKAATNSLHVAVSRLRKLLTSCLPAEAASIQIVHRHAAGYSLSPDRSISIDVEEFRSLVGQAREWRRQGAWTAAAGAYRDADALYHGDLLDDDPHEEWAIAPRRQMRGLRLALFEELADCLVRLGSPIEAVEVCERGLMQDQTREGLYVQLMGAHAAAGYLAAGLQTYERCRRAVADELGVDPGPAVQAMHARLLGGAALGASSVVESIPPRRPEIFTVGRPNLAESRRERMVVGQLRLPCIGREDALTRLASSLEASCTGRGQLVLIHGEPGIGKSRLLEEFGQVAMARGVRLLAVRCYEMDRDLPYAPVVEALTTFLLEQVNPSETRTALGQWGPQIATLIPALYELVPDLPRHRPLRSEAERAALLAGLTHLLTTLSRRAPLTLLLDDLQWADASTLQLLHYLARRLAMVSLLLVGAYRTSEVGPDHALERLLHSLAGDPAAPQLVELGCLTLDNTAALFPSVSGSPTRGRALAERLHRETDGHPLFLVESVQTLLETGVLTLDRHGNWHDAVGRLSIGDSIVGNEGRLPLPPSLREAIQWRIKRLNERERRMVSAVAVMGHGFGPEILSRMLEIPVDAALDGLESLVMRQFLWAASDRAGFDFRHDIIREAVYDELGPDRRRFLHARVAVAMEALVDERPGLLREVASELARHCLRARRWAPSFQYSLLAGDHARSAFAPREALAHYRRAAEVADQHSDSLGKEQLLQLLERLGRVHADLGELDEAARQLAALLESARESGDHLLAGRMLVALADIEFWRHDFGRAEAMAGEAFGLSRDLENRGLLAGALISNANIAIAQGHVDEAEQHCRAVLTLARTTAPDTGSDELVVAGAQLSALGWLGLLWQWQGDHGRAMTAIEESLRLGRELHNPFLTGRSRFALGMSLGNSGRYDEAIATLQEALRLADQAGDRYFLPRLLNTIGWIYSEVGDLARAEEWNQRSIVAARETGWLEAEANARVNLGGDAVRRGDRVRARAEFERALDLVERDNWFTWRYRMRLLLWLGELALLDGAPTQALAFATQVLSLADPTKSLKHAGHAWLLSGRSMLASGARREGALQHLKRAHSLAVAAAYPPLLWASGIQLAHLHAGLGHETEAAACRSEVLVSVQAVADGIKDTSLRRSFFASPTVQAALANA